MDKFNWSDSLVNEYANLRKNGYYHSNLGIEDFKASKQPNPDYEILTCYQNDINIWHNYIGKQGSYKGSGESCEKMVVIFFQSNVFQTEKYSV